MKNVKKVYLAKLTMTSKTEEYADLNSIDYSGKELKWNPNYEEVVKNPYKVRRAAENVLNQMIEESKCFSDRCDIKGEIIELTFTR